MTSSKHGNDSGGAGATDPQYAEGYRGEKKLDTHPTESEVQAAESASGSRSANDPNRKGAHAHDHEARIEHPGEERDGGHRLFENRTQHDEGERNSEKGRRDRDLQRHDHDAREFQGHEGHADAPGGASDGDTANIKNTGKGGGNRSDADRA